MAKVSLKWGLCVRLVLFVCLPEYRYKSVLHETSANVLVSVPANGFHNDI